MATTQAQIAILTWEPLMGRRWQKLWESMRPFRDREIGNSKGSRIDLRENYIFKVWGEEQSSQVP